ncbi:MAG TPA: heme o synthase [Chthoniobacterales bacterium]
MKTVVALPSNPEPAPPSADTRRSGLEIFLELVKSRLTALVLITTLVGFQMGVGSEPENYFTLIACMLGTALCAAGAAALNELWERDADSKMLRTKSRPLPAGELQPMRALWIGLVLSIGGVVLLGATVNSAATALAAATILLYVLIYTPLKKISTINTLVGAIPGALPPMIGYVAASGRFDVVAGILFAILFLWQIPHFLAISWMYKEDYIRGGFVMLSGRDSTGFAVASRSFIYTLALVGVTLLPNILGINNLWFAVGSVILGVAFAWHAWRFLQKRDIPSARALFFASITYLPLLLGLMVFTRK